MKPNWPTSIFECDKQIRSRFSIYRAWAVINSHWEPSLPNAPGKDKIWEEANQATMVIAAGRREGRQANDWWTFNEKRIKHSKAGLFLQNLCETDHPGDYEHAGILSLNPEEIWGVCTRWPQWE